MKPLTLTFRMVAPVEGSRAVEEIDSFIDLVAEDRLTVTFPTDLHGLAFWQRNANAIRWIERNVSVDSQGFEDWSRSAPGELEASKQILPLPGLDGGPTGDRLCFRYDDAWVYTDKVSHERLALGRELKIVVGGGSAGGIWRAVKVAWKYTKYVKYVNDPRVQAAWWLAKETWSRLNADSVQIAARQMAATEALQRFLLREERERRQRLNGPSRVKWQRIYATQDKMISLGA